MADDRYDIIIIGSGPGGATAAWRLAQTGKRILLIERGQYLPRERENWDTTEVFGRARYQADETWKIGRAATASSRACITGSAAIPSSTAPRCSGCARPIFTACATVDGVAPEWPLKYDVFEPYYQKAEELYRVHGARGEDPTEPWASGPYPKPPIRHEPRIAELAEGLAREGLHPFHLPIGAWIEEDADGRTLPDSPCLRCDPFDGYPEPDQRQGRRAGRLRRSRAEGASQSDVADGRLCRAADDRRARRARSPAWRHWSSGDAAHVHGGHRDGRLRRAVLGAAVPALGERRASRTASPTAPAWSGATTCATTTRPCWRSRARPTRRSSRRRWGSTISITATR